MHTEKSFQCKLEVIIISIFLLTVNGHSSVVASVERFECSPIIIELSKITGITSVMLSAVKNCHFRFN